MYYGVSEEVLGILLMFFVAIMVIALAFSIVVLVAKWKLYKKAGKGGWEVLIPFYSDWVLMEIAGLKWYWFLINLLAPIVLSLMGIPSSVVLLVSFFVLFNTFYNISKRFNKGIGFAICAVLFNSICIMILGFSRKAKYDASIPISEDGVFGKPSNSTYGEKSQQPVSDVAQQPEEQPTENKSVSPAFCANCGNALMPNAKFCTNCGKQI